jgi:hypothetical protein
MDGVNILPLAITMMAGPQIMSAIIFVTTPRPVRTSLAFLLGVATAVSAGVAIMLGLGNWLASSVDLGDPDDKGSVGHIIEYVLVGLLIVLAVKTWLTRATAEPPKWLGTLMTADPRRALKTGLLLIFLMPSDIVVMATVGVHLAHADANYAQALPFIGLTVLVAALPLLGLLLFRQRAMSAMPRFRDWMNSHSWLVNIVVCVVFILLLLL